MGSIEQAQTVNAPRNLRAEQAEKTKSDLIAAARRLFAEKGYFATGTHEIVDCAQVTRGALYHHFPQKDDLFRAVFHAVQDDLLDHTMLEQPVPGDGRLWHGLKEKLAQFFVAARKPEVQRILLQDGPAVLGWSEWRALEAHYGLAVITRALEDGMKAGLVREQAVEPLSLLILAIINEASLYVANAPDDAQAVAAATAAINTLLGNLT